MELKHIIRKAVVAAGLMLLLLPGVAFGRDLPGVADRLYRETAISGLKVTEAEGIVILRGRVATRAEAASALAAVQQMGYSRVANMLEITPLADDEAIERIAERELYFTRGLDGCRFRISSNDGIVTVQGTVTNDFQKELAVRILERLDGVHSVRSVFGKT